MLAATPVATGPHLGRLPEGHYGGEPDHANNE
jgi:hypothetical protein